MLTFSINNSEDRELFFVELISDYGAKRAGEYAIERKISAKVLDRKEFLDSENKPFVEGRDHIKGKGNRFVKIGENNDMDASSAPISLTSSFSTPDFQEAKTIEMVAPKLVADFANTNEYEQFKYWYEGNRNYVDKKVAANDGKAIFIASGTGSKTWALESQDVLRSAEFLLHFLDKIGIDKDSRSQELMESLIRGLSELQDKIEEPLSTESWQSYSKKLRERQNPKYKKRCSD